MFFWKFCCLIRRLIDLKCIKIFGEICWSCSIRYSFKRCLALTVFLFKFGFFGKFLWFDDPSGRSAAGRMAPMAQFQLPAVRVVNPTEPSVRFRDDRGRFSPWVRTANVPWRESDQPYPWVLQIKMRSIADCPTGYASRIILVDEMRTRFPPRLRGAYCNHHGMVPRSPYVEHCKSDWLRERSWWP